MCEQKKCPNCAALEWGERPTVCPCCCPCSIAKEEDVPPPPCCTGKCVSRPFRPSHTTPKVPIFLPRPVPEPLPEGFQLSETCPVHSLFGDVSRRSTGGFAVQPTYKELSKTYSETGIQCQEEDNSSLYALPECKETDVFLMNPAVSFLDPEAPNEIYGISTEDIPILSVTAPEASGKQKEASSEKFHGAETSFLAERRSQRSNQQPILQDSKQINQQNNDRKDPYSNLVSTLNYVFSFEEVGEAQREQGISSAQLFKVDKFNDHDNPEGSLVLYKYSPSAVVIKSQQQRNKEEETPISIRAPLSAGTFSVERIIDRSEIKVKSPEGSLGERPEDILNVHSSDFQDSESTPFTHRNFSKSLSSSRLCSHLNLLQQPNAALLNVPFEPRRVDGFDMNPLPPKQQSLDGVQLLDVAIPNVQFAPPIKNRYNKFSSNRAVEQSTDRYLLRNLPKNSSTISLPPPHHLLSQVSTEYNTD